MHPMTRFWKDRGGNFGVMTAFLLVPLIGTAGMALDFGHALTVKQQLVGAADAAAVGAIAEKSKAVAQAMQLQGDGSVALDPAEARSIFLGQMSGELSTLPVNVDIEVAKNNGILTSRVSFSATLPTTFMTILGKDDITVSGNATAQYQTPSFLDFYMLLDNTPSMGVGANSEAIERMKSATRYGSDGKGKDKECAFACHIVHEDGKEDPNSYYNVAKQNRIPIRIDVVAEATKTLMKTATDTQTVPGQFRMAAYTFGERAQDAQLFKVAELNENLTTVGAATEKIKLMSIPKQNYNSDQQTSFDDALTRIGDEILSKPAYGLPGNGTSKADRQKIVFLVADGVGDSYKPNGCTSEEGLVTKTAGRCIEPIDTKFCQKLKEKNIRIAVLYTTYLPLHSNEFWKKWVEPFDDSISTKMKECASPGYFFEVSLEQGIADAMNTLFHKIVATPRITS
ncbi:TadE/TadG family type IV pilus assembly protein [Neorhizobium galegae]|uniref:TadE/TadG family type IV pilus assembly protein n=1 Tax=Neorhizobium galegae TaxID=399 RepID=UPI001F488891|nr:TadE/TadG family type IV pilus assembly protein [Neorhizobium galegae]UIK07317.1 pilus assembly protein [Neorhizobium galegae]